MPTLTVDLHASLPHYADHLRPIWDALPEEARGVVRLGAEARTPPVRNHVAMVGSFTDMYPLRGQTSFIYVEHGAGQSYGGDPRSAHFPDYSASRGARHGDMTGYICPNERVAALWAPARTAVVGSPRLDWLLTHRPPVIERQICFTFHWPCKIAPEADSAWMHYAGLLPEIAKACHDQGWTPVAHLHPKWEGKLDVEFAYAGIELVSNDAALRSAVLACDNSSTMYEAAALGRSVITLNAPWYRRDVNHGMRFWDAVPGMQVDDPNLLTRVDLDKVVSSPAVRDACAYAARYAYAYLDGSSSERAAEAILGWIA